MTNLDVFSISGKFLPLASVKYRFRFSMGEIVFVRGARLLLIKKRPL